MYDQIAKRYYDTREKHFIEKEKDKKARRSPSTGSSDRLARVGLHRHEECYSVEAEPHLPHRLSRAPGQGLTQRHVPALGTTFGRGR